MIRFLDPSLLVFCLAAAVPPIVAWLGRRGAAAREWAAMEILSRAADRTAFRRRCIDWLVVAMRSATLVAVGFAAARPLFVPSVPTKTAASKGQAPNELRAVVVGEATAVAAAIEAAAPALGPVKSITEPRFDDEPFEGASLVVLADGVVPGAIAARRLSRFVDRGGGVALLVGPRTSAEAAAALDRFPGAVAGIGIDGVIDRAAFASDGEASSSESVRLTATAVGEPEIDLAGPAVRRAAKLVVGHGGPGDATVPRRPPEVLARAMPSGNPLAVRVRVGRGAVGIIAVPLAVDGWSHGAWSKGDVSQGASAAVGPASTSPEAWTDLPAWPSFLPFVERTILSLVAADGEAIGRDTTGAAGWLAGRNLSGLALVAALTLVLLDPLVTRSTGPGRRMR